MPTHEELYREFEEKGVTRVARDIAEGRLGNPLNPNSPACIAQNWVIEKRAEERARNINRSHDTATINLKISRTALGVAITAMLVSAFAAALTIFNALK